MRNENGMGVVKVRAEDKNKDRFRPESKQGDATLLPCPINSIPRAYGESSPLRRVSKVQKVQT